MKPASFPPELTTKWFELGMMSDRVLGYCTDVEDGEVIGWTVVRYFHETVNGNEKTFWNTEVVGAACYDLMFFDVTITHWMKLPKSPDDWNAIKRSIYAPDT